MAFYLVDLNFEYMYNIKISLQFLTKNKHLFNIEIKIYIE